MDNFSGTQISNSYFVVGPKEVARLLGVSRECVDAFATAEGFPAPVAKVASGNYWNKTEIERWAAETGRLSPQLGRQPSPANRLLRVFRHDAPAVLGDS